VGSNLEGLDYAPDVSDPLAFENFPTSFRRLDLLVRRGAVIYRARIRDGGGSKSLGKVT